MAPWRKILYQQQPYPDNYVDDSFLDEMKKNVNTRIYDTSTLIFESGMISQQLSSIAIFVCLFMYMDWHWVLPSTVFMVVLIPTVLGYMAVTVLFDTTRKTAATTLHDIKNGLLVSGIVFGLSPILETLTKTVSTDTIYAMTVFMLTVNFLMHDYVSDTAVSSRSLSLNASVFASVCLASRLPTSWHAFVTVITAMQIFALMPLVRLKIKELSKIAFVLLTWLLVGLAFVMVTAVSNGFALALAVSHLAISFLFPWWMVKLQRLKNNIHGPWDEAMINE